MKIGTIVGAAGVAALAAGSILIGTKGELGELSIDGGIIAIEEKPLETAIAVRHLVIDGKKIRIVGGKVKVDAEVTEAELGRTVEAEVDLSNPVQCSVVLRGDKITGDALYKDGSNKDYPNLPDIKDHMLKVRPVKIGNSCVDKNCYWNGLFHGDECEAVVKSSGYVLSSMQEALDQPEEVKARILTIQGTCETPEKVKYDCYVPYGDSRAIVDGDVRMPHNWANLNSTNFAVGKSDKAVVRYTIDDYRELQAVEIKTMKKLGQ